MRTTTVSFSWPALIGAATFVLLSGAVAASEGTFTSARVTMGFVNHGGMWGDLLILPFVAAIVVPRIPFRTVSPLAVAGTLALACVLTVVAHQQWAAFGATLQVTDHVFPTHATGRWYSDISVAGWMHVAYMAAVIAILLAYCVLPLSPASILIVSALLTVHLPLGEIQPGWYTTGEPLAARNLVPPAVFVSLTWLIAWAKFRHLSRSASRVHGHAR